MKIKRRWLNSVVKEAAKCDARMPWTRGAHRDQTILRRATGPAPKVARA